MKKFKGKALSSAVAMAMVLGIGATFMPITAHASTMPKENMQIKASRSSVIISEVVQEEPGRYGIVGSGLDNIGSMAIYDVNGRRVSHILGYRTNDSYVFYNAYGKTDGIGKAYLYDREGQLITVVNVPLFAFQE